MKKAILIIILFVVAGAVMGHLGRQVGLEEGRQEGYDAALRDVGEYLFIEADPLPWEGRGDAGFTLCIALTPAQKAGTSVRQCLHEVRPAAVEQTEAESILEEEMQYPPPEDGGN